MPKYRKIPVVVEAEQFWRDQPLPFRDRGPVVAFDGTHFYVTTVQGQKTILCEGDWVILEPSGDHRAYPCDPIFFKTYYEPVKEPDA